MVRKIQSNAQESIEVTPRFITWTEEGETISGKLVARETLEETDFTLQQYTLWTGEEFVTINGTYNLNKVLPKLPMGTEVRITFVGKSKTLKGFQVHLFKITLMGPEARAIIASLMAPDERLALPAASLTDRVELIER